DQGLVEQLAAGLTPDAVEPSQAESFPAPPPHAPTHALPYWEQLAARLRAEVAALSPQPDRRPAAVLHYELGRLCDGRLGRAPEALAAFQSAFELDPTFVPNLRALKRTLIRRGNFAQAAPVVAAELEAAASPAEKAAILIERAR